MKYCLWLEIYNDEGEDVTPRPLVLIDPFSIYDSTTIGAMKTYRQITKVPVCHFLFCACGSCCCLQPVEWVACLSLRGVIPILPVDRPVSTTWLMVCFWLHSQLAV